MEAAEVKQKAVRGARWTLGLSAVSMPVAYGTNIMLGRINPEALGTYGVISLFVSTVTTFILFGGGSVLVKFLPEVDTPRQLPLVFSYFTFSMSTALILAVFVFLYPDVVNFIIQEDIEVSVVRCLLILIPLIVFQQILVFALNGFMEIGLSVLSQKVVTIANFVVFTVLLLLFQEVFMRTYITLIWITYTATLILATVAAAVFLIRTIRRLNVPWKLNICLPSGFWRFTAFAHASTVLVFGYEQIDKIFVLTCFSVEELGLYLAALQTIMLIRFVPQVLGQVLLPTFSNLLASGEKGLLIRAHYEVTKATTLAVVPTALICVYFSREIMGLFGPYYVNQASVLAVLGFLYSFTSMGGVNSSLIIARGRTGWYFLNSSVQVGFQLAATWLLVEKIGAMGAAIGRGGGVLIAQVGLWLIVRRILKTDVRLPRAFVAGTGVMVGATLTYCIIQPKELALSFALYVSWVVVFLLLAGVGKEELRWLTRRAWRGHN
ncbi:MAG: polysaccharide biosynthesis C-terminal domain-containing protein [Desulfobacteria bacterium]